MSADKPRLSELRIDDQARSTGFSRILLPTVIGLVIIGVLVGAWFGLRRSQPVVVKVATVEEVGGARVGGPAAVLNATGYVTARRRATVSSKITGKVVEVHVEEGMAVKQGQVLARLDDAVSRRYLELSEAELNAARRNAAETEVRLREAGLTLNRARALVKDGISGQADLDRAEAEVDALRARLELTREQVAVSVAQVAVRQTEIADMVIRAPFSGVAITKDAQPGEMISPVSAGGGFTRTGICTIVDMTSLEIEVDVNESFINRVSPGQKVEAVLDAYPDWRMPAHVITAVPTADRQRATVLVRIGFESLDPRLLPDMGVKVAFLGAEAPVRADAAPRLVVPRAALRKDGSQDIVFVVVHDTVERRAVRANVGQGDTVDIVTGLAVGERVVVDGPAESGGQAAGRDSVSRDDRFEWHRADEVTVMDAAELIRQSRPATGDGSALVSVRDVHKVFHRGGERIDVLQGLSLEIPKGDFLALMGPSGSGKSTLLNLLGGLDRPSQGSIDVGGQRIDQMSGGKLSAWRARHVGFVFQLYNLLPVLTAERNVELPLLLTGLSRAQRRQHVATAMAVVGLSDRAKHYPRQLSGGQEQRVGIARAIVTDPTLLLCDEPTGDLDRKAGDGILDLLQALNREHGKTIIMVTHDPHAAARATRVLHLDKGVLVKEQVA